MKETVLENRFLFLPISEMCIFANSDLASTSPPPGLWIIVDIKARVCVYSGRAGSSAQFAWCNYVQADAFIDLDRAIWDRENTNSDLTKYNMLAPMPVRKME